MAMPRSRASAKKAGSAQETLMANYFAEALGDDRIERRRLAGSKDVGDIGGIRVHGQKLCVEVKNCAKTDLPGWIREAHTEARNDGALCGVVTFKRRGTTDPGSQFVVMEARDLVALITGKTQEGCHG